MKQNNLYPKISAQLLNSPHNKEEFFLFNSATNKGFAIDGFAAILCKKFDGKYPLGQVITEFEVEQKLEKDEFKTEIEELLSELEKNRLLVFFESAQVTSEEK